MASMYAVYHGPEGLKRIARRVKRLTDLLAAGLRAAGATVNAEPVFDTLTRFQCLRRPRLRRRGRQEDQSAPDR
jgi:glycine cleavage system pyridoxal-binding protein P